MFLDFMLNFINFMLMSEISLLSICIFLLNMKVVCLLFKLSAYD